MNTKFLCPMVFAVVLSACNQDSKTSESTGSSDTLTKAQTTVPDHTIVDTSVKSTAAAPDQQAADFVNEAAIAGMMEIELGNIAQSKTKNSQVSNYGKMMVTDHTAAANELKANAAKNSIAVPAELPADKKDHINMMKEKSGSDFDKAYIDMMQTDHKTVIGKFETASTELNNADLKAFAAKTLPVLEKHLNDAKAIRLK